MKDALIDDLFLATNIRQGDKASFTKAYQYYHPYLYRFALRFLKSSEHAEEVVHDVFLKLWENRERLHEECSLKGYLVKICKNHILNILTRATRERAIMQEIGQTVSRSHNETENTVVTADYEARADQIISQLPPQRQKVFRMYRFDEMNSDEISQQLGISKGTVKDHLLKANRYLRKYLHAHTGIPIDITAIILAMFIG